MLLENNDCLRIAPGQLIAPPFCGRCYLYRMFDLGYSALVRHDASDTVSRSIETTEHGVETHEIHVTSSSISAIDVHFGDSAQMTYDDLRRVSPVQLALSKASISSVAFREMSVQVEWVPSPVGTLYGLGRRMFWQKIHPIYGTGYAVRLTRRLIDYGRSITFEGIPEGLASWKITVVDLSSNSSYTLESRRQWSLTVYGRNPASERLPEAILAPTASFRFRLWGSKVTSQSKSCQQSPSTQKNSEPSLARKGPFQTSRSYRPNAPVQGSSTTQRLSSLRSDHAVCGASPSVGHCWKPLIAAWHCPW